MTTDLPSVPVVGTAALTRRWLTLLSSTGGPGDPRARTLWVSVFDADDLQLPVLMPVDDVPARPDEPFSTGLAQICAGVLAEHASGMGSAAMALERPGPARVSADDRAWEQALTRAAAAVDLAVRPLHLAGRGWVLPLADGASVVRYPARGSIAS